MNFLQHPDYPGRQAWESQVKQMLGLPKKLPAEGLPGRYLQGIWVWVEPAPEPFYRERWGKLVKVKSSKHRVMAECPRCQAHLSVGRLKQHKCEEAPKQYRLQALQNAAEQFIAAAPDSNMAAMIDYFAAIFHEALRRPDGPPPVSY